MSILAGLETLARPTGTPAERFRSHFTETQRVFLCSTSKTAPMVWAYDDDVTAHEFIQPHPNACRALVIDIDHEFALGYINDLPQSARPHAIVLTTKGLQAFWLIETVPTTREARREPIRFAQDVAERLRQAVSGDPAVNPLHPVKCRNPLYEGADIHYMADCPPYSLKDLNKAVRGFLSTRESQETGQTTKAAKRPVVAGDMAEGGRNQGIFDAIRHVAYRGGDYETLAYELAAQCDPPLPESEVAGIVRSVAKFMATKYKPQEHKRAEGEPLPPQVREFLSEIGRKGRAVNSEKQQAQQEAFIAAGTVVRRAQAIGRKAQIQALKEAGYKQREVAEKMGISIETVKRGWRAT